MEGRKERSKEDGTKWIGEKWKEGRRFIKTKKEGRKEGRKMARNGLAGKERKGRRFIEIRKGGRKEGRKEGKKE